MKAGLQDRRTGRKENEKINCSIVLCTCETTSTTVFSRSRILWKEVLAEKLPSY